MAASKDTFTVNGLNPAGCLLIIRDDAGVEITRADYSAGSIIFSARPAEDVLSPAAVAHVLSDINSWQSLVALYLGITDPVGRIDYDETLHGDPTFVRLVLKFDGVIVMDAKYRDSTGMITFQPRPMLTLSWAQFIIWCRAIGSLLNRSRPSL